MSANDIALIVEVVGFTLVFVVVTCGLFSREIVNIIRAIRGEKEEDE